MMPKFDPEKRVAGVHREEGTGTNRLETEAGRGGLESSLRHQSEEVG